METEFGAERGWYTPAGPIWWNGNEGADWDLGLWRHPGWDVLQDEQLAPGCGC